MYTIYTEKDCQKTAKIKEFLVATHKSYREVVIPRDMTHETFKHMHPKAKGLPALLDIEPRKNHDHSALETVMKDVGIAGDVLSVASMFGL